MAMFALLVALSTLGLAARAADTPMTTLPGHFGPVLGLVFSPDGETLATASGDVQFWDFKTGTLRRKITDLGNQAYAVDISPDGSLFATGTAGSTDDNTPNPPLMEAKIWDYSQETVLKTFGLDKLGLQEGVRSVAFSPDGTMLAVGGSDHSVDPVKLFDVSTGAELHELSKSEGVVKHLAFNGAGTMLAICRQPNSVELWSLTTKKLVHKFLGNRGEKVAFSPDGKLLAYGKDDKTLYVMNVETGQLELQMEGHNKDDPWGYVMSVAFSPDGAVLASGSGDSTIVLWNVTDGTKLRTIRGHTDYVASLAFTPDGTKLVSGADEPEAKVWDITGVSGDGDQVHKGDTSGATGRVGLVKIVSVVMLVGTLRSAFVGIVA